MKKILVPTDFSELAFYACDVAVQLARKVDAWVYLLHVDNSKGNEQQAQEKLEELKSHPVFKGVNVTVLYKKDKLEGSILSEAQNHEVDLIVMGSHGKGAKKGLVGSNTARVVRLSNFPVLVIKSEEQEFTSKNIVFASNFYGEVDQVFPKIKDIAYAAEANIHLLKVITPKNFENTAQSIKRIKQFAEEHRVENYTVNTYNHETKEQGILQFADSVNADLIALVTHGRKGLSQMLLGSLAENVANRSEIPVLSIKLPEKKPSDAILFPD